MGTAGTNLVLIEPDLANVFPDTDSVNRALRLLADTAEAAAGPMQRARRAPNKRLSGLLGNQLLSRVASPASSRMGKIPARRGRATFKID
jgi:hypothetical protein